MDRQVIRTAEEFMKFMFACKKDVVAIDTETTSLKYMELDIEGFSLCDGKRAVYIDLINNPEKEKLLGMLALLMKQIMLIVGHNLVYDLKVLHKFGVDCQYCTLHCTMVADHLLDENREHGLKFLAQTILGKETKDWGSIKNHQSQEFYDYALNDAEWTYALYQYQVPLIESLGLRKLFYNIEMPFQWVIFEMEITGVLVDLKQVTKTSKELKKAIEDMEIEMYEILKIPYKIQPSLFGSSIELISDISFTSGKDLTEILFTKLGLDVIERTPKGAPSVGKKTIEALKDKHPFVAVLHKYKIAQKLLSAFFEPLPMHTDADGRVRPSFRDTGTVTGRLSCQNPNLQQLPKVNKAFPVDTRAVFVAKPGYKMIGCDYSGQELRVLTQVTKEPVLIDTFIKGKDMHLATANDFFNLQIPEESLYEKGEGYETYKKKFKAERDKAKIINFGIAYGKGAFGFSKDFNISEEEAQAILDKYFAALPGVKAAIDRCHAEVRDRGCVRSMAGRYRRFTPKEGTKNFFPGSAYRESFNFLIQGFSADMIRKAAIMVQASAKENPQWDLKTIASIHDEMLYEVREEYAETAAQEIKRCFETAVKFCIPVVAEVSIGRNYSECK